MVCVILARELMHHLASRGCNRNKGVVMGGDLDRQVQGPCVQIAHGLSSSFTCIYIIFGALAKPA